MFDKLEDLVVRLEEILSELQEPDVANDQNRFRKLMKEQNDLTPIVEAYQEYKTCKQNIEDSLQMLEEESDEELRELAKEELNDSKARVEELEHELKILLLPKDPNDEKNVVVEIRAGAGGDEAALFAAEIYRMYLHYAESQHWKVELVECEEIGIGGMKNVTFMIDGKGAYSKMKYESGVHRVQRVPETESGGRIHTSTITVAVMPEAEDVDIQIDEKDIRIIRKFAVEIKKRLETGEQYGFASDKVPGNPLPAPKQMKPVEKSFDRARCTKCQVCVQRCPVNAISQETLQIREDRCLNCMSCVKVCKAGARGYDCLQVAEYLEKNYSVPKEIQFF